MYPSRQTIGQKYHSHEHNLLNAMCMPHKCHMESNRFPLPHTLKGKGSKILLNCPNSSYILFNYILTQNYSLRQIIGSKMPFKLTEIVKCHVDDT